MPRLYVGEQLGRIVLDDDSDAIKKAQINSVGTESAELFTKVASRLGFEAAENEGVDFGDSFVKFASEDTFSGEVAQLAENIESIVEAIKVGRVTAIDENLRNLFNNIEEDDDLASSIHIREILQSIQGPEA